jgi:3-phenylpropionate/cinnamic acid dioxygenase small subunit
MTPIDYATLREAEEFLYREAGLADDHRFDEWLALWTKDALYWVPCNEEDVDPKKQISVIYDDWKKIDERCYRLKGRHAHAQAPRSRLCRVISNVQLVDFDRERGGTVTSRFVLGEVRRNEQIVLLGKARHKLVRVDGDYKMKEKWVYLINNDTPMSNLTYIV